MLDGQLKEVPIHQYQRLHISAYLWLQIYSLQDSFMIHLDARDPKGLAVSVCSLLVTETVTDVC